jgi:hypothetical protein
MKQEYDDTDYNVLEIREEYEVPRSDPATVLLNDEVDKSDILTFIDKIKDSSYALVDPYVADDGPYLSSKVYDSDDNEFFNIEVRRNDIKVFPRKEKRISSFFRFFEFIQSNVDDRAEPMSDTTQGSLLINQ